MKILLISNKMPYPPVDGGAIATFNMARGFQELGHEVHLLSMNTRKHYFSINNIPQEIKKMFKLFAVDINTDISLFKALTNLIFSSKPYNAVRFIKNSFRNYLADLLKKENYDIIQLEGLYLLPYIPVIREYSEALISYRAHNIEHEIWNRMVAQERYVLKKQYLKILAKRLQKFETGLLNSYDVLVPITDRDAHNLNKFGNIKPYHTTQTGVRVKELDTENVKTEFPSLFHIGALDWAPNQEGLKWFIENIWKDIHALMPSLYFYVAGRNAPLWIEEYLKKIPGLKYYGEVQSAYKYMKSKAIMLVPLMSGSGMRIKIIEGMALGKAIISTSIGAEGIGCTNKSNIIIADTIEDFKDAIISLVNAQTECERIGRNAQSFVLQNFEIRNITSSLVEFYKKQI